MNGVVADPAFHDLLAPEPQHFDFGSLERSTRKNKAKSDRPLQAHERSYCITPPEIRITPTAALSLLAFVLCKLSRHGNV